MGLYLRSEFGGYQSSSAADCYAWSNEDQNEAGACSRFRWVSY
ncbi:hypothetical protein VO64_2627 [Pseudomonas synxantha]|uniref:Uncharacterized protein n=1 Tax=Pseudomonas synxantha TaxID=47883 RepID=A0AAU8TL22_9PSED|nr:hypothetical protein VO64_2627 [Pseudomonas synxantha]